MRKLKEFMKKFLPSPVRTFIQELNRLRDELTGQATQLETRLDGVIRTLEEQEKRQWEGMQALLDAQIALSEQLQRLEDVQRRGDERLEALGIAQEELDQVLRRLEETGTAQCGHLEENQRQQTNRICNTVWDSRNGALWETKDEIGRLGRQLQQIYWYHRAVGEGIALSQARQTFFRALPPAEGKLRTAQRMEFYLLQNFRRICEENGLRYWLQGGSLLGAVRHEGFIPWDDDLDVAMPRPDFNRLRDILRDSEDFAVVDYYQLADRYWLSRIPKFTCPRSGTGFFVDIFAFDPISCPVGEETALWNYVCARREELCDVVAALLPELAEPYRDVPIEDERDRAKVDALFDRCTARVAAWKGSAEGGTVYCWGVQYVRPTWTRAFREDVILPTVSRLFEGEPFQTPAKVEDYLREEYPTPFEFPMDVGYPQHWKLFSMEEQTEKAERFLRDQT